MGALREILAVFDIDTSGLERGGKKGEGVISGLKDSLSKAGAAIGGSLLVSSIKNMVTGLVEQGSALNDTSAQLGISTDALQSWQFAARLNGVEAGELSASLTRLMKGMADASAGGAATGGKFQQLGVSLRDAHGNMRDATDVLYDTGLAIAKLPSAAERTAASLEVFGKAGRKLGPLFNNGEAGLKDYLSEVKRLGGGISEDAVGRLDDLGDSTDRLDMAMTSAKSKILFAFLPSLTKMIHGVTQGIVAFSKNKDAMDTLKGGVVALGAAGAAAGAAFLLPWLPAITAFALLGLLVQDLMVGLNGGDSEIGHLLDKAFGKGTGDSFFKHLNDDLNTFRANMRSGQSGMDAFWNTLAHGQHFGDLTDALKTAANQASDGFWLTIQNRFGNIGTDIAKIIRDIFSGDATIGASEDATQLGRDLITALINGMKQEAGNIASVFEGVVGMAINEGENRLSGHSGGNGGKGAAGLEYAQSHGINSLQDLIAFNTSAPTVESSSSTRGGDRTTNNTMQSTTSINITTTAEPGAIGDAVKEADSSALRATYEAMKRTVSK